MRILTVSFLLGASIALAETTNRMPEVVVTATRTETATFDLPFTTQALGRDVIQDEHMSRTVPETLREVPSVMIQKTANGQGSPFIRGFTGFRTLFLIDGIRLNNSTFRDGPNQYWNTVDPFTVDRLELVKGPSSVLYGSDAIGGTVNALTLAPPDHLTGRAYYRFASAEDSHTGRAEFGDAYKSLQLLGGATVKSYGDLNNMPKTGYDEYDIDAKAVYATSADTRWITAFQHVTQNDAWRTHRTIFAESFHGSVIGTDRRLSYDQQRDLTYLQYHAENLHGFAESLKLSASYQFQGEDTDRLRSNYRRELAAVDVHTMGLWAQFISPSPVGTWTYGVEYYRDWVNSAQTAYNSNGAVNATAVQGPVADDATYDLAGVYVQDQIQLPARWELTLGGRYTYARAGADQFLDPITKSAASLSKDWHALAGSARVMWQVDDADHWRIFGGVSQGFRAPNLSDLTRLDTARSGEIEAAAPDLDPENFIAFEAGIKTRYETIRAEAAYFYTLIDNMIVRQPTGNIISGSAEVTKRNSGEGYLHGIEASAAWQFHPQLSLFGWITWMEGKVDGYPTSAPRTTREDISRLMPLSGEVGVRWDAPSKKFWIETVVLMADKADQLSAADALDTQRIPPGGTPGYGVWTLRGGWRVHKNFTLTAACENLLDKEYRIHGSGINEPRRNFIVAGNVHF